MTTNLLTDHPHEPVGDQRTDATHAGTVTRQALLASADRVLHAARSAERPFLADEDLVVSWQSGAGMYTNIAHPLVEPDDWAEVIGRIAAVVPAGSPVTLATPWSVPDLADRGWFLVGHPPLMVRPPAPMDPATRAAPAQLTIHEATDEPGLEVFERTLVDSFPDPTLQPYRWGTVHDGRVLGGPTRFFTGFVAGRPVATAAGHVAAGVNLVEMVATDPQARGCGYGEAVTWAATLADPTLPAVLLASDLGRPVYERMGFLPVARWTMWHRPS